MEHVRKLLQDRREYEVENLNMWERTIARHEEGLASARVALADARVTLAEIDHALTMFK